MSDSLPGTTMRRQQSSNRWLVLTIVCLAQLMVAIDVTIVNVALPTIQTHLGFTSSALGWVINAYTVVFGGFLLLGGRAGDLLGRRLLFVTGLAAFTIASVLCAISTSPGELITFRAIQGLGAAMVSPAVVSIITTVFTDAADRTRALSVWGGTSALATALGVILGGVLTQALSWPWVFWVNAPIGVIAILLALRHVPESKAPDTKRSFDFVGAVTVTASLLGIVYAIVKANTDGWGSASTLGFGLGGLVLLALFLIIENRHPAPLIQLNLFRSRTVTVANVGVVLLLGANAAFFYTLTIYLQEVLGYSPLRTGLAFVPLSIGMLAGATLAGKFIARIGLRPQAIIGLVFGIAAFSLLTQLTSNGNIYFTRILLPLVLNSVGIGAALVPLTVLATANVAPKLAGLASGVFNTSMQAGGALGLAILSTVAASRTAGRLHHVGDSNSQPARLAALVSGYHLMFAVGTGFFALAGILLIVIVRRKDLPPAPSGDEATIAEADAEAFSAAAGGI